MFWREAAAAATDLARVVGVSGCCTGARAAAAFWAARLIALAASAGSFGAEAALVDFALVDEAFAGFLTAFFAAFLTDFFAAFFAVFLAFLTARFFVATRLATRFAAFLAFFFFADFLATIKSLRIDLNEIVWGRPSGAPLTASLPQASKTPRKPAVFAQDYSLGCRARCGRSFPTPPPAVQGGAGFDSRSRRRATVRRPICRCCRQRPPAPPGRWCRVRRRAHAA